MTARSFPLRLRKDMDREGGRGGIPSGEENKMQQKKITIRPSEAEYEQIQDLAKRSNKSVNRCLIDAALGAEEVFSIIRDNNWPSRHVAERNGMAVRGSLEGRGDMLFSGIAGILSLGVRILCSYAFKPVFGNMVVAYAEAFSWIFLLAVLLLRYGEKVRQIKASGSGTCSCLRNCPAWS